MFDAWIALLLTIFSHSNFPSLLHFPCCVSPWWLQQGGALAGSAEAVLLRGAAAGSCRAADPQPCFWTHKFMGDWCLHWDRSSGRYCAFTVFTVWLIIFPIFSRLYLLILWKCYFHSGANSTVGSCIKLHGTKKKVSGLISVSVLLSQTLHLKLKPSCFPDTLLTFSVVLLLLDPRVVDSGDLLRYCTLFKTFCPFLQLVSQTWLCQLWWKSKSKESHLWLSQWYHLISLL